MKISADHDQMGLRSWSALVALVKSVVTSRLLIKMNSSYLKVGLNEQKEKKICWKNPLLNKDKHNIKTHTFL
jgi:hypothetical protein